MPLYPHPLLIHAIEGMIMFTETSLKTEKFFFKDFILKAPLVNRVLVVQHTSDDSREVHGQDLLSSLIFIATLL